MVTLSRVVLSRIRPLGLTLPIERRDAVPVIKFPASFANLKKVKKNLRFVNSYHFKESTKIRPGAAKD